MNKDKMLQDKILKNFREGNIKFRKSEKIRKKKMDEAHKAINQELKEQAKVMADIDISLKNIVFLLGLYVDINTNASSRRVSFGRYNKTDFKTTVSVFGELLKYNNKHGRRFNEKSKKTKKAVKKKTNKKAVKSKRRSNKS